MSSSSRKLAVLGALYLLVQTVAAILWWAALWLRPELRHFFIPAAAPGTILLAFFLPDALFFIGAGVLSAWGMAKGRSWAWTALLVHSAAAAYAALYCLSLWLMTGEAALGALFMAPCLIVQPYLLWKLKPVFSTTENTERASMMNSE